MCFFDPFILPEHGLVELLIKGFAVCFAVKGLLNSFVVDGLNQMFFYFGVGTYKDYFLVTITSM